ncbi:DUF6049 family protein [Agromyces archimandritae]|uniref:2-oxoglutarate dehydrogenase n=1 Tax=Agromyces archimandritae TaxID=2781962 RepID=A0A975FLR3_9MICO|nr:DUF6049 family protein [Agromyces archimandritae]QTX03301.1 hypothetical protein G127AT_07840 [Agromyces archimandritae]
MVAESIPARRLRRLRRRARVWMPGVAVVAAALLATASAPATAMTVGPDRPDEAAAAALTVPAHAEPGEVEDAEAPAGRVSLTVAPVDEVVRAEPAAQPLLVSVELANGTGETVPAGVLRVLRSEAIGDPSGLQAWLGASDPVSGTELASVETRDVPPGDVFVTNVSVPRDLLPSGDAATVYGLAGELVAGGEIASTGRGSATVAGRDAPAGLGLAIAYPLTVPPSGEGLVDAEDLETWTGPEGLLTRQLDAVEGRGVAIGLDPRILASIRVLGSAAPESAVAWLERLQASPNEVFPLSYADADVAVQSQLGLDGLLAADEFSDALDPQRFEPAEPGGPGETETPPASPEPTSTDTAPASGAGAAAGGADASSEPPATTEPVVPPTADPDADPVPTTLPTNAELLAWNYTRTDLAWPAPRTVATGDLQFLARQGLTTAILDAANVDGPDAFSNASVSIEGTTALVAEGSLSTALSEAATASSEAALRGARADAAASLTLAASAGGGQTLLAAFGRELPVEADRIPAVLDTIEALGFVRSAGLSEAIGAPPQAAELVDSPESDQRRSNVDRMMVAEREVDEFSSVAETPAALTAPVRRDLLAVLGAGWVGSALDWDAAVGENLSAAHEITDAVSVVPSSAILVVSRESGVPVSVQNELPVPATVIISVEPENGRLVVEDDQELTVEAGSRAQVQIPVAAGVGNGEVQLAVTLTSPTGVEIGGTERIVANVQADWEGIGAIVLAVAVVAFFGFGVFRMIRRRRRSAADADGSPDAEPGASAPDPTEEPSHG